MSFIDINCIQEIVQNMVYFIVCLNQQIKKSNEQICTEIINSRYQVIGTIFFLNILVMFSAQK